MKRGILEKPKFGLLCADLGWGRAYARGVLDCLYEFVGRECPRGDLGAHHTDEEIAMGMCLEPQDAARIGDVIDAMVERKWLARDAEARLVVVDWDDECPDYIKRTLKRRGEEIVHAAAPASRRSTPVIDRHTPDMTGDAQPVVDDDRSSPSVTGHDRTSPVIAGNNATAGLGLAGLGKAGLGGDSPPPPPHPTNSIAPLRLAGSDRGASGHGVASMGGGEQVGVWSNADIDAIIAAYPTGKGSPMDPTNPRNRRIVATALQRLRDGLITEIADYDDACRDPARWLLGRVRLFGRSDKARRGYIPAFSRWMGQGRGHGDPGYSDDPAEWQDRVVDGAAKGGDRGGCDVPYRSVLEETPDERREAEVMR